MAGTGEALKRQFGLVDVYAISTGAMFSSGLFLLPGIAYGQAGAWMILAYLLSGVLVIPAMLSMAELSSAMPKAGGTYYFLDRAMGPLMGTIGGLGTWIAMLLKNTFALIGMGAYVALVVDIADFTGVAVVLAVVFTAINVLGAKETAGLQRLLVFALVTILGAFVVEGLGLVALEGIVPTTRERFALAPTSDVDGVLGTIGLVFVSYAGLTKVASVAEEVERPERNIILGMSLSLLTAVVIYTFGAYVLVLWLDPATLPTDLTPIASASEVVFAWMPWRLGFYLILVAAIAAFASTANAGIMSASRYLLAMGRDRLIPSSFATVGARGTPTRAVLFTGGAVVTALLTLDVVTVAKLASAFQLLMFAMVNLAVVVMRESGIGQYRPGYRSPLYPWTQIAGIFLSLFLIIEMGRLAIVFSLLIAALPTAWFFLYAKRRVVRRGAILHWFERLGRDRFDALETELGQILVKSGRVQVEEVVVLRPSDNADSDQGYFVLPEGYIMDRLDVGRRMSGRTLRELALSDRYGVTVVAVDRRARDTWDRVPAEDDLVLAVGDRLVLVGNVESIDALDFHREDEPTQAVPMPRVAGPPDRE